VTVFLTHEKIKVPEQPNADDCGLYVLHFSRVFLQDPVTVRRHMLESVGMAGPVEGMNEVWEEGKLKGMRKELKKIILETI
jgi:Ulp1 family protease